MKSGENSVRIANIDIFLFSFFGVDQFKIKNWMRTCTTAECRYTFARGPPLSRSLMQIKTYAKGKKINRHHSY